MMQDLIRLADAWPLLLAALLAVLLLIFGVIASQSIGQRLRLEWMWVFFVAVPAALVASVVFRGRDLSLGENSLAMLPDAEDIASGNLLTRAVTLVCLAIALERVARFFLSGEFRLAVARSPLLFMMGFIVSTNVLASLLGSPGGFRYQLLYAPLVALAVFAYAQTNAAQGVIALRNALLIFFVLSFAALALKPAWVADLHYRSGIIPGFDVRFYGFATHPNTLAPLCLLLICSVRLQGFKLAWMNWSAVALGVLGLLLTQSKTSIVLAAAGLAYLWWTDLQRRSRSLGGVARGQQQLLVLTCITLAAGLAVLFLLIAVMGESRLGDKILLLADRLQLSTVTGRTRIWDVSIQAAMQNPLFGYGPGLWDVPFRIRTGLPFTHAHNQFVHTFGAAGIVGLVALSAYLVSLGRLVWRTRGATRGVGVMLFGYLLLRGLTELPFNISNAMQGEFIVQLFLLIVCIGAVRTTAATQPATISAGNQHRMVPSRSGRREAGQFA